MLARDVWLPAVLKKAIRVAYFRGGLGQSKRKMNRIPNIHFSIGAKM